MPKILTTKEAEIRRITVQSQPRQKVCETLSRKKPFTKIELVELLKVKALSSSPNTTKKKKKKKKTEKKEGRGGKEEGRKERKKRNNQRH
jgi:hypothetical protein